MTTKFTKGPWKRDAYGHIVDANGDEVHFRSVAILASSTPERIQEAEANTTLATSAPELLDACKWLLNCMQVAGWEGDQASLFAQRVIEQATGESHGQR